jgi:glycosyltransferase involved in cell wall biosynthesis
MADIGKFSMSKLKTVVQSYFRLRKILKRERPGLVYFALSPYGNAFIKDAVYYAIIASFGIPVVFHLHGKGIKEQGQRSTLFHQLYKRLFKNSEAICLSQELISDVAPYKKDPFIIPNGLPPINGLQVDKTGGTFRITYLSNLIRSKGILEFLYALGRLKERGTSFSAAIIGKSGDISETEINDLLSALELTDSLHHFGPLYDEEKYRQLLSSDLLVFPTRYPNEALPLVVLEGMQCGLPVISTREGGIPSLIDDGQTGFLINGESSELADKIEVLINNPRLGKAMGLAGKKKFEQNFTLNAFEQNLANVLQTILEKHSTTTT